MKYSTNVHQEVIGDVLVDFGYAFAFQMDSVYQVCKIYLGSDPKVLLQCYVTVEN